MKVSKEKFFKLIDSGDHLNASTKESYWSFYTEQGGEDLIMLYKEGQQLYPDSGIHEYIKSSLNKCLSLNIDEPSDKVKSIESPMDRKSASTWGYNSDVGDK